MKKEDKVEFEDCEYIECSEKEFGVFVVTPILLHPEIKDKNLIEKERRNLAGKLEGLNKGQVRFNICFHSRIEMLKVYLYLLEEKGYNKLRLLEEKPRETKERVYKLEDILNGTDFITFSGCGNILKLTVNIKDLSKFKEDILSVSGKFNIKNIWESEESIELKTKKIIN